MILCDELIVCDWDEDDCVEMIERGSCQVVEGLACKFLAVASLTALP